jgi:AcrR family transcriptional regulator
MILDAAVEFFAEHGFGAQIKDLADRLGISQGLIFRYFATKQNLVEQVYEKVFLQRWSAGWEAGLRDRAKPLQQRLEEFYLSYFRAVDESHWIRVSLYASLAGHDIIGRYIQTHVNKLLTIIARELRACRGLPEDGEIDPIEFELPWHLHSTFIYYLVRKYVHRQAVAENKEALVARIVANFLGEFERRPGAAKPHRRKALRV